MAAQSLPVLNDDEVGTAGTPIHAGPIAVAARLELQHCVLELVVSKRFEARTQLLADELQPSLVLLQCTLCADLDERVGWNANQRAFRLRDYGSHAPPLIEDTDIPEHIPIGKFMHLLPVQWIRQLVGETNVTSSCFVEWRFIGLFIRLYFLEDTGSAIHQ